MGKRGIKEKRKRNKNEKYKKEKDRRWIVAPSDGKFFYVLPI
jgi:hypothetical protein